MLELMTDEARAALTGAAELAGTGRVDTRHLLLALLAAPSGVTATALRECGLAPDTIRAAAEEFPSAETGQVALLPGHTASRELSEAVLDARRLAPPPRSNGIGTGDLLGALAGSADTDAARLITGLDVPLGAVRAVLDAHGSAAPAAPDSGPLWSALRWPGRFAAVTVAALGSCFGAVALVTFVQPEVIGVVVAFVAAIAVGVANRWLRATKPAAALTMVITVLLLVYGCVIGGFVVLGDRGRFTAAVITSNTPDGRSRECGIRDSGRIPIRPDTAPCQDRDTTGSPRTVLADPEGQVTPLIGVNQRPPSGPLAAALGALGGLLVLGELWCAISGERRRGRLVPVAGSARRSRERDRAMSRGKGEPGRRFR